MNSQSRICINEQNNNCKTRQEKFQSQRHCFFLKENKISLNTTRKEIFTSLRKGKFVNLKKTFVLLFGSAIKIHTKKKKNKEYRKNRSRRTNFVDGKILIFPNIYSKHFSEALWNFKYIGKCCCLLFRIIFSFV